MVDKTIHIKDHNRDAQRQTFLRRAMDWFYDYCLPHGRTLNQLKQRTALLSTLYDKGPVGFIVIADTQVMAMSENINSWLGISSSFEEIGEFVDCLTLKERPVFQNHLNQLRKENKAFDMDFTLNDGEHSLHLKADVLNNRDHHYLSVSDQQLDISDEELIILWIEKDSAPEEEEPEEDQRVEQSFDKTALDAFDFPIWSRNQDKNVIWGNKAFRKATGVKEADILAKKPEIITDKANLARGLANRAFTIGKPASEKYHSIVDGERHLLNITEVPYPERDVTLGYAWDVSSIEDMSEELERFKSSTSELMKSLTTGVVIFSPDKLLTFYNDSFARLFHLEDAWLNKKPKMNDLIESMRQKRRLPEQANFKEYKREWLDLFTELIEQREEMMHLPDGTAIRQVIVPHLMGGLFMTFEDVTSRLELESNYNTLIAVQQETLANLAEGLVVFGTDGRLQLYNPVYANMWDLKDEELDGNPHITEIIPKLETFFDLEQWEETAKTLLNAGLMREERIGRLFLDDDRVLEYVTVPLPDGGMLTRFLDVTDTLLVEKALLEKNAALEEAERLKLDFLANVSYQLRTPLNAMMGFAEVLDKEYFGEINERQREYTKGMIDAGDKLIGLINDILDLSTIEAGYLDLNLEDFDVYQMVKSVYDLTKEWAGQHDIELKLECPKTAGRIKADQRRLKQALLNVISNAIKFTPSKGKITLKIVRYPGYVDFVVRDTGIGVSKKDQEKIFTPFVQVRKKNDGAGLGLTLVKKVIELHGGHVELESAIGQGTRITCRVPAQTKKAQNKPKAEKDKVKAAG